MTPGRGDRAAPPAPQNQIEVTGGGRVWHLVDTDRHTYGAGIVLLVADQDCGSRE